MPSIKLLGYEVTLEEIEGYVKVILESEKDVRFDRIGNCEELI